MGLGLEIEEHYRRVETARYGPFLFQVGADARALEAPLLRVADAQDRFRGSPLSAVANALEREVLVSSIFGTNSIEGGVLSEQETQLTLDLDPEQVKDVEQRRALNMKAAYRLSRQAVAEPGWRLDMGFVQALHAAVTDRVPHEHNRPGMLRDNPKGIKTRVGDHAHGGLYQPPQYGGDVRLLLETLLDWHGELRELGLPVLLRAPLVHYYYELIHPFWDGNGRVGRVLEATLLQAEGFRYAPFAQARFYLAEIDRYFALFSHCRKLARTKVAYPNTPFLAFFLEGMLKSLNRLHDRVNRMVRVLLFENELKRLNDEGKINPRQYAIVTQLLASGGPVPLAELRRTPWYLGLYAKLTDQTKQRDLRRLREAGLIRRDRHNRLWPGFADPEQGRVE